MSNRLIWFSVACWSASLIIALLLMSVYHVMGQNATTAAANLNNSTLSYAPHTIATVFQNCGATENATLLKSCASMIHEYNADVKRILTEHRSTVDQLLGLGQ